MRQVDYQVNLKSFSCMANAVMVVLALSSLTLYPSPVQVVFTG